MKQDQFDHLYVKSSSNIMKGDRVRIYRHVRRQVKSRNLSKERQIIGESMMLFESWRICFCFCSSERMYERLLAAVTDGGFHRGLADVAGPSMLMRVECAFVVHWGLFLDFLEIQSSQGSVYSSQLFWDQRRDGPA